MHLARVIDGRVTDYPYPEWQLRADHPNTSFPADLAAADFSDFGVVAVTAVPAPQATATDMPVEGVPAQVDGVWTQTWTLQPRPVPAVVTMRQARLALLGTELLTNVDSAIAAMSSPAKEAATIEWEYAAEVRRDSPLISALGTALGLSEAQVDALFTQAARL